MATTGEPFGLFWDSENGDRTYSAASFEYWLKKFFTSGVFNGDLQVKAKSGMTLEIDPGYANVDGKVKFWNGAFTVTLDAANSTYTRIDTIIIRRDNVNRQIICEKVTGSYSADTPQPTAPTRNSEIYDLVTAQIYVGAGVTEITQSNITDTRPNNELCGYITGTVEELDFSAFTAQFEAYFAEFKRNQMADFQAWEVAQQAAYAAWFSLVQQQQVQDKADWDAWYAALQEELHELPEDTAEYLQIQIDEIRTSGTTGSILKISTTETSLEGKTVTVTNGTETRTATFDENLECLIAGYKGTGEVTISSSDGIQTASTVVTIPYFGNYQYAIAFWAATVNIQGDDNLKGATITVKDSDDLTVGTVVLNVITGRGVFTAQKADTYTFNFTYQGTDYSESLIVDEQITYSLSLSAGFNWRGWVDTAQFLDSTDYNSLDEVLADEEAVRELCLEHACVDYLAAVPSVNTDIETIINNDLFAKWANNSDYSLDVLGANVAIKSLMDTADKYFYGEWVITDDTTTPPTWGAKGNVPVMTANNAPYGEVSGTTPLNSNYSLWKAFNGTNANYSDCWYSAANSLPANVTYKSTTPMCVKKVKIANRNGQGYGAEAPKDFSIRGSNDGTTWKTLGTFQNLNNTEAAEYEFVIENNSDYFLYHQIYITTTNSQTTEQYVAIANLQFYGRELSVSVPTMTGNTTPYGEAFARSEYGNPVKNPAYYAFDGNDSTLWADAQSSTSANGAYVGYRFTNPVNVKAIRCYSNAGFSYKIQYSDDGVAYTDATSMAAEHPIRTTFTDFLVADIDYGAHKYWRLILTSAPYSTGNVNTLQFYGLDYSEKEFEEGTTKKWLYDHGVELETLAKTIKNDGTATPYNDYYEIYGGSSSSNGGIGATLDLTPYDLFRAKIGGVMTGQVNLACGSAPNGTNNYSIGYVQFPLSDGNIPNNMGYDISSIDQSAYINVYTSTNNTAHIDEMWLE